MYTQLLLLQSHKIKMKGCFIGTWWGGGNLVPIVCGLQAIITFFQANFLLFFFFLLFLASICFSGSNSSSSWPSRLALIPLLFIAHSVNLIILVIPYLNVSSSLDLELHEVRGRTDSGLGTAWPQPGSVTTC